MDNSVFEDCRVSWSDVLSSAQELNKNWGFPLGMVSFTTMVFGSQPRNVSVLLLAPALWRAKKVHLNAKTPVLLASRYSEPKTLVRLLQHVEKILIENDKLRQSEDGIASMHSHAWFVRTKTSCSVTDNLRPIFIQCIRRLLSTT